MMAGFIPKTMIPFRTSKKGNSRSGSLTAVERSGRGIKIAPHQEAIQRLTAIPGIGPGGAERIVVTLGPEASTFPSGSALASWLGVCPGMQQSAGTNYSGRPARGNQQLRGVLWQMAWAAVHTKGSYFQSRFQALVPKHGAKKAISIIVHLLTRIIWKVLHMKERYVEKGARALNEKALLRRASRLTRELRRAGYQVAITTISQDLPNS